MPVLAYRKSCATNMGFTLVEIIAVIIVILVLAGIVLSRVGDLRSGAFNADAQRLTLEVNKAVELAVANGVPINRDIYFFLSATPSKMGSTQASDAYYMGLTSVTWHLSTVSTPDPSALTSFLRLVNNDVTNLTTAVSMPSADNFASLLKYKNCDVVLLYSGANLQSSLLVFQ
jgi:type II secretory pathway pseudopilin PulG